MRLCGLQINSPPQPPPPPPKKKKKCEGKKKRGRKYNHMRNGNKLLIPPPAAQQPARSSHILLASHPSVIAPINLPAYRVLSAVRRSGLSAACRPRVIGPLRCRDTASWQPRRPRDKLTRSTARRDACPMLNAARPRWGSLPQIQCGDLGLLKMGIVLW